MIKKLRFKLISVSMASLLIVLFVIEGMIGIMNYRKIVRDAEQILEVLSEYAGRFPEDFPLKKGRDRPEMSPEIPFESRYFSVLLDEEGNEISVDIGKVAAIGREEAVTYAARVWNGQKEKGFMGNYRYMKSQSETGIRITFLDCRRQQDMFRNLVMNALGISLAGLGAVLLLISYLSSRIMKPFSDNYEKQKRFITDAGHELRTPLTIINADTEVLEMNCGKENEWLLDIRKQTKRMRDLTNTLIALSRMEEGIRAEMLIDFPISDMLEEIVNTFRAPARLRNLKLSSSISPMISMKGEQKSIHSLLTILLDNAVKYSDEGGTILVTLEKKKNRIRLSVFNTAKSISREQISHLFDRFYRTDSSRNSETGGYGLGLSIAASTVAAHGGKITAETKDEKSLQISISFPA